jgi:hypothetical protein
VRTPTGVLDQLGLFVGGRLAVLLLDFLEDPDGLKVGADLGLCPTLAEVVLVGDPVIEARALGDLLLRCL